MKVLKTLRFIALIAIIYIIVKGVFMMIGEYLGLTEYHDHLLVVGLALVLLSEILKIKKLDFILFALGLWLIIINY